MAKSTRHLAFYGMIVGSSLLLLFAILGLGPSSLPLQETGAGTGWIETIRSEFARNFRTPLASLIAQIFVILAFSRMCALILKRFHQPQVVGEMIAGILLGKSAFAILWPEGFAAVFPDSGMSQLYFLSQIGLIFFMFVVGLDLKVGAIRRQASAAAMISHVSIVFPFLLGAIAAVGLYGTYGPVGQPFPPFVLFMGLAMSVTAFPVLARILQERGLVETPLGTLALACAAIDDVTAWCVLAAVVGISKAGTALAAVGVVFAGLAYVVVMVKVARPLVAKVLEPVMASGRFSQGQMAFVFCVLLGSALISEAIGIHALFGSFLAGAIMPSNISLRSALIGKIEDLSAIALLPIFFAFTGLRMEIGLLGGWAAWLTCLGIVALAIIGKMAGSALAARFAGLSWRESWTIGTLMNTRGLTELVVLNIGYDLGILPPTLFAIMVIMALVTTVMASPMLEWTLPLNLRSRAAREPYPSGGRSGFRTRRVSNRPSGELKRAEGPSPMP